MHLQSLFKLTIGLLISVFILASCGGDAPADNPTQDTEPEETVAFLATDAPTIVPTITPSPVLPPPTPVPLDEQLGDLPAGQYTLSLAGTLNSDLGFTPFDTGLDGSDYKLAPNGTNLDGPYEVVLWTDILTNGTTDDTTAQVIFTIPASIEPGEYDVIARDSMSAPTDIGVEIVTGFQTRRFGTNATGTINIVANGGVGGVFSGEFEVTIGDAEGNTILATGRLSGIGFLPQEAGELIVSGALDIAPPPEEIIYLLARDNTTAANNDWRLDVTAANSDTNPFIIQHRLYMVPNIAQGTYEIVPRVSALDARPETLDVTAYVELFNTEDGTSIEATDVSGTLEVLAIRDSFSATFTLNYTIPDGQQVTATGGGFYLYKPAG